MDPKDFGVSTIPLKHEPYGPILPERLAGVNKGKVAVVTGAHRGIGQAISIALANSGANLALLDLSLDTLQETKIKCESYGVKVETFACDIRDASAVHQAFVALVEKLGPVDILVNNAGAVTGKMAHKEGFAAFWNIVEINFKGTMLCVFEVLQSMMDRKSGCIINLASRSATISHEAGLSYCSSKAAVARATGCLQEDLEAEGLGEQVHTYSLHPGAVWGAMVTSNVSLQEQDGLRPLFKDVSELCGNTVAYLSSGKAKDLRGLYIDCRQDLEMLQNAGRPTLRKHGFNNLGVKFLPGFENEP
ncbi:3-oxoacyl-reductase [Elsinoe ampelina]|uniref:3-oxoacyl-reductase n=1 Tax=Elsinoe ampelina TaxID=302913 RepID=A0A6A6GP74_9PEZI|nr:3-oxoacyl-reductase [Elsinoe ampelina]